MRALGLAVWLVCVGIVGCAPDFRLECEEQVQCSGGNDKDIDACIAVSEVFYDFYDDIECGDEYDAYYECIEPLTKCRTVPTGQMCMVTADCGGGGDETCSNGACVRSSHGIDQSDNDKCMAEKAAFGNCFDL